MAKPIDGAGNCLIGFNRLGDKTEIVLVALFLTCSACDGEGTVEGQTCPECQGEGVVLDEHNAALLDRFLDFRYRQEMAKLETTRIETEDEGGTSP